jgi:hypothetical protein
VRVERTGSCECAASLLQDQTERKVRLSKRAEDGTVAISFAGRTSSHRPSS